MSQQDQTTRAQALAAIAAQQSAVPSFGDLGAWLTYHADTAIGTAAVHIGERSLAPRTRRPNRRPQVSALIALGFAGYLAARKAGTR